MKNSLAIFIVFLSYSVISATLNVDINGSQSYTNIQDAINDSPIGGWTEIYIYPGVYHENLIVTTNQHLLLSSTNEFSEFVRDTTIIDGDAAGSVITILGKYGWQEGTTCTVAGVTITNGFAASGGGIYGSQEWSSPHNFIEVRNCLITSCSSTSNNYNQGGGAIANTLSSVISNKIVNNYAAYGGGGLYRCYGDIYYNLIANNVAREIGGGVAYINNKVFHNIISNNVAQVSNGGGMIYVNGDLAYNLITRNYAGDSGGGGYSLRSINIYNNEFSFNVAGSAGGGIGNSSWSQANVNLINNLICNNIASNSGGGIYYLDESFALNNTIVQNYGQYSCGGVYYSPNTLWINNIINNNISDDVSSSNFVVEGNAIFYNCCLTDVNNIDTSNISSDPDFVDASNYNYHLKITSPCVNTGLNNMFYTMLPWHDLDGNLRNQNGIDMGCYELGGLSDSDGDLLVDANEVALLANSNKWDTNNDGFSDGMSYLRNQIITNTLTNVTFYVSAGESIQDKMAKMVSGDLLYISTGVFQELLVPYFGIRIIGTTNEFGEKKTILDGENKRSVILNFHDDIGVIWGTKSLLANLIITNGNEYMGGGIFSLRSTSNLSIDNCDFIGNQAINGGAIASPKKNVESTGLLKKCNFINNSAQENGGAIYNMSFKDNIENCLFVNNSASNGAAISKDYSIIDKCVFSNNVATAFGGALYQGKKDVKNSLFVNNKAQNGGAIASAYYYSLDIQNNTFCKNSASMSGGAIYETSKQYDFLNNIVWGNTASNEAQIYLYIYTTNYFNNTIQDWTWMQNNNLSNDPRFIDFLNNNFHLNTNSYCIDSGTNTPSTIFSWFDLDENYRVIGDYVDRGCYEFYNAEDDIDYDNCTNRIIIILQPPGGGKIIKKVVIYKLRPCESNERTRISTINYPLPSTIGDKVKTIVTAGDNSTLCVIGDWEDPYYQAPGSKTWDSFYDIFPGYSSFSDVFPCDGHMGWYGGIYNGSKDNVEEVGLAYSSPDNYIYTQTIAANYLDSSISLPENKVVISGENNNTDKTSWVTYSDPSHPFGGWCITETLSVSPPLNPEDCTPAHVDVDGNKTRDANGYVKYDSDKIWIISQTSGNVTLKNINDNSTVLTLTTPLTGGGDYLIGSFPDGLAVAEKNTKTFYTYVYNPTTPGNGSWCTDTFKYIITKLGYSTTRQVIPEPFLAVILYLLGFLALYKMFKK